MTVRTRLMITTALGVALITAFWGLLQLKSLENILRERRLKKLFDIAETVGTYYQHFPNIPGLSALDATIRDHLQSDISLAQIEIFSISGSDVDSVAGVSRVSFVWPKDLLLDVTRRLKARGFPLATDGGPALGLLLPYSSEAIDQAIPIAVGVISFSKADKEILSKARNLLVISTAGFIVVLSMVMFLSYGWLIGRPLGAIARTIDEFRAGNYLKRIHLGDKGEWGQLARHFNSMADEIERVLARDRRMNLELNERVQEATRNVIQLQSEVNRLQRLATLGYVTATLAHDMGTPLHSIAGLAKLLLERGNWPPETERKLHLIVQQTERLNASIQNVRKATRLPEPRFESVDVAEILNETLPLLEPMNQNSGIRLTIGADPGIPRLYVDRHRVQTALLNLLQNAFEANSGTGEITVSAAPTPEGRFVAITVKDTGSGIAPELMQRVFEPFFSTRAENGLRGLGLSIVRDIAKIHGGDFRIESETHSGTTATLYFPVVEFPSKEPAPSAPSMDTP